MHFLLFIVRLCADYQDYKVFIQQLGKRPCGFNGFKTRKDIKFIGKDEDCLEILYGKYVYQIEFNPPSPKTLLPEKRAREIEISNEVEEGSCKVAKLEMDDINRTSCTKETQKEEMEQEKKHTNSSGTILKYMKKDNKNSDQSNDKSNTRDPDDEQNVWDSKENGALLIYTMNGVIGSAKVSERNIIRKLFT